MFDDDTSYLDDCARQLTNFGLKVFYPYERCVMGIYETCDEHLIGIIRKKEKIPFYQGFMIQLVPTQEDYLRLVQEDRMISYVFENRDKVRNFACADISGHDNFQTNLLKMLKEQFK